MAILDSPQRRKRSSLGRWAVLALLMHLQILLVAGVVLHIWAPRQADLLAAQRAAAEGTAEPIAVSTVDDDTARKLIADMERLEEKAKQEQVKKEEESTRAPGQVVDLARPREEKRPENARFAAEYDSSVEHETRKYGKFDPNELQKSRGASDRNRMAVPEHPTSPSPPGSPGALAMRTPAQRRSSVWSTPGDPDKAPGEAGEQAAGPSDPEGLFAPPGGGGRRRALSPEQRAALAFAPGSGVGSLLPSEEEVARAAGTGTQDYLRDVDEGEETALNSKKWKFAYFFNRVKEQVRNQWKPVDEFRRRDPTGAIYGAQDRLTQVHVRLRPDGSLAKVSVSQTCGVDFLDDTAVEAFKQAQPFPNPPRQLVVQGLIDFDFGFFLEISGSPRVRFLRYKM